MRISMVYKSTHVIALMGALFFIISLLVCILFFQQVEQEKVTLTELRTTYAQAEQNRDMLSTLVHTLESTKGERASLTSRILTDDGVVDFLALIEALGREQQVILKTNTITIQPINTVFETVVVNVSIEGSYDSLIKTLTLFENIPYQSSVINVEFTRVEGGDTWETRYDILVTKYKKV